MESTQSTESRNDEKCTCGVLGVQGWCVDCMEALCEACVAAHRRVKLTRSHKIQNQPPSGQMTRSDITQSQSSSGDGLVMPWFCNTHIREPLQLFCYTCGQLTCRDCQLMAHRNHRFQFVREALQELNQELDSMFHRIGDQKSTMKQSLLDMNTRLQHIEEHKSNFKKVLRQTLFLYVQKFKSRLSEIFTQVETEFQKELDEIESRKCLLKDLENKHHYLVELTKKAKSNSDLLTLLDMRSQVGSLLKEFSSPGAKTPQLMIDVTLLNNQASCRDILNFGDLQTRRVPFSLSPVPIRNVTAELQMPSTPSTAVGPQSSTCPAPPSSKPFPQSGSDRQLGPYNNVNQPFTSYHSKSNRPCPPASSYQVNTQRTTSTSVYPAPIGQPPSYSASQNNLLLKPNTVQASWLPAMHSNSVLTSENMQPQLPYQAQQLATSTLSQTFAVPVLYHQGSLVLPVHSNQTKPVMNVTHLSAVSLTLGNQTEASNSSGTLDGQQPPTQRQSLSEIPQGQQAVSQCSSEQRSHDKLAYVSSDQQKHKLSPQQCLIAKSNHQYLNTNQIQSRVVPVTEYQPVVNVLGQLACQMQCHPNSSRTAVVLNQPSAEANNNLSPPNEASSINEKLVVPINQNQSIMVVENKSPIVNQLNNNNWQSVSPHSTTSIKVMQKHPLLTKHLLKSSNGSFGEIITFVNDGKSDTGPLSAESDLPLASSPDHQSPTQTIKAAADSACETNPPSISILSARSEHQAAENEPTSTVSEIQTNREAFDPILSEFIQFLDNIKESVPFDSDSVMNGLEGGAAKEPIPMLNPENREAEDIESPSPVDDVLGVNQVSPVIVKAEEELSNYCPILGPKLTPNMKEEEKDPQTLEKTRSDWTKAALQQKETSQSWKPILHSDTVSVEPSSPDEPQFFRQVCWQPTVQLIKLSIARLPPGHPLPRFRVLPGDTKDVTYLQEIDECHNQSHDEDVIDFLEPLSSPESPPVLHTVNCAACHFPDSSIICVMCGRGFHRACHIPPIGLSIRSDWTCALCLDLEDMTDPYSTDRRTTACLSILDQRKCEHILLFLTCECSDYFQNYTEQASGGSSPLRFICERLCHFHSPPYRTPTEFISDIWNFLHFLSIATENNEELLKLQENFQAKLVEMFGSQLHPSLLQHHITTQLPSTAGPLTNCHTQSNKDKDDDKGSKDTICTNRSPEKTESRFRETRKRLKRFLEINLLPAAKKQIREKDEDKKELDHMDE